jgi:GH24 family phage-related lysozyme (muramidase)
MMKLIPEWKSVATGAWSFLFSIANALFLAAAAGWEALAPEDLHLETSTYLAVGAVLAAVTGGSRLIQQDKLAAAIAAYVHEELGAVSKRAAAVGVATVMARAGPITAKWEGLRTEAYRDVVGIWTVCAGETRGVKPGDSYTVAECEAMLETRVLEFYDGVRACAPQIEAAPVEVQAAVTSWAYNVGVGAACRSTLARHLRAGEWRAACEQLPRWNRAGGRVWQGLVNRRADERRLCMSGLT